MFIFGRMRKPIDVADQQSRRTKLDGPVWMLLICVTDVEQRVFAIAPHRIVNAR
jgi:hypothetical protein